MTNINTTNYIDPKSVYAGIVKPGEKPEYTDVDVNIDLGLVDSSAGNQNIDTFTPSTTQSQEQLEGGKDQVSEIVSDAGSTQGSISAAASQVDESLSQIASQVEDLNAYSAELAAWNTALTSGIGEIDAYITSIDSNLMALGRDLQATTTQLSTIEGQLEKADALGFLNTLARGISAGNWGYDVKGLNAQKAQLETTQNGLQSQMTELRGDKEVATGVKTTMESDLQTCSEQQRITDEDLAKAQENQTVNTNIKNSLVQNLGEISDLIQSGEVKISDYEEVIRKVMEENNRKMSDEDITKLAQSFFDADLSVEDIENAAANLANGAQDKVSGMIDRGSQYIEASSKAEDDKKGEVDPVTGEKVDADASNDEAEDEVANRDAILAVGLSEENNVRPEIAVKKVEYYNMMSEYKDMGVEMDFQTYINTPKNQMNEYIEKMMINDVINSTGTVTATKTITSKKDLEANNDAAANLLSVNYAINAFLAQNPSIKDLAADSYVSTVTPIVQGINKGNTYETSKLSQLTVKGNEILASLQSKLSIGNDDTIGNDSAFSALSLKVSAKIASMESENDSQNGFSFGSLTLNNKNNDINSYKEKSEYYITSYKNAASASDRAIAYAGLEMIWERMQNNQMSNNDPYQNDERLIFAMA